MITRRFQEILKNISIHFNKQFDKELNVDLLTIFNYVIVMYSRNVFNYHGNWKKIEKIYDFDFDYINEQGVAKDLLHMQKEYRRYGRLFDIIKTKNNKINNLDIESYRRFINESIKIMITKIIVPMNGKYNSIIDLIKKYEYLQNEPKKQIRSDKINYDALEKFLGKEVMIQSGLL
jgi:hypothetical protein